MINITSSSRYKVNKKSLKRNIGSWLANKDIPRGCDLNVIFVGKNKMRSIAKKYKKEDVALPVLSFPYLKDNLQKTNLIGEIFICYPQAILLSAERNKKVDLMLEYLVKHGIETIIKN